MSQDLIKALEHCEDMLMRHSIDAVNGGAIEDEALNTIRSALSRHRSSVESVELPEPEATVSRGPAAFFVKFTEAGKDVRGKHDLYTASTVRSLIAAAVERERALCAGVCEDRQASYEAHGFPREFTAARACAAAIRARGEK